MAARCESCSKVSSCDIVDDMVLCDACAIAIKTKHFDIIQESRNTDAQIRSAQDLWNAKTVATIDLIKAIRENDSIVDKNIEIQKVLTEHYEHLAPRILELESELFDLQAEKSVVKFNLDQLADNLRKEYRERIKIADANYQPPEKKNKVKIGVTSKKTESPFERMVKMKAQLEGISETEARIALQQGAKAIGKELKPS
jgi:hypothetical protein